MQWLIRSLLWSEKYNRLVLHLSIYCVFTELVITPVHNYAFYMQWVDKEFTGNIKTWLNKVFDASQVSHCSSTFAVNSVCPGLKVQGLGGFRV